MHGVEPKCTNEKAVLRITRANDGRLAPTCHGKVARFEIETGVVPGVLAVMALEALAFDDGPDVTGEVDFRWDAGRVKAIFRIIVRAALTDGAGGEENSGRQGEGGENEGPGAHERMMLQHEIEATRGLSDHGRILS